MCVFQRNILRRLSDRLGPNFDVSDNEYIANNLLKVNVFYRQLCYKEIVEEPGYKVHLIIDFSVLQSKGNFLET